MAWRGRRPPARPPARRVDRQRSTKAFSITKWPGVAVIAFDEAAALEQRLDVAQHVRAAADHHPVSLLVQRREVEILEQLLGGDQVGDAAGVAERLARHRRIVDELFAHAVAQKFVAGQLLRDALAIGELGDLAHAVNEHDALEAVIDLRILDQAQEGREAGAGAEQIEMLAGQEIVEQQRAGRLAADDDGIAFLEVLELRGEGPVRHLDREELQRVLVVGADKAIGAQKRAPLDRQADHGELPVLEAEAGVARGGEAEQRVGPVMNAQHAFLEKIAHASARRQEGTDIGSGGYIRSGM